MKGCASCCSSAPWPSSAAPSQAANPPRHGCCNCWSASRASSPRSLWPTRRPGSSLVHDVARGSVSASADDRLNRASTLGVQGQAKDGNRSNRRATRAVNSSGNEKLPGCLAVARGSHLGEDSKGSVGAADGMLSEGSGQAFALQAGHITAVQPTPGSCQTYLNPTGRPHMVLHECSAVERAQR